MSEPVIRRLDELADLVGGRVVGDGGRTIEGVASLERAGSRDLAFVTGSRYAEAARSSAAGAILVREEIDVDSDLVVVDDPGRALVAILEELHPTPRPEPGVHSTAVVYEGAEIDPASCIGPHVVIGGGTVVEENVVIGAGTVVGEGCRIGEGSTIHPRVVLYPNVALGRNVVVHAGAVLGSDGFGYVTREGRHLKIPQIGRLVVEDDVEVGANSAIDRAALDETRIGAGSKLDNLVQVGHNVRLGPGCIVCGQAGIAGSVVLGAGVVLGGQAGVVDHLSIGDGVQIAGKSAVFKKVDDGEKVAGIPATEIGEWRRTTVRLGRLGELFRRVARLESEERE